MVEEVLLRVTGVGAEMGLAEMPKTGQMNPAILEEIELTQRLHNPDVHGKGFLESVGEEQDAIGDFYSDAGKFHEFRACFSGKREVENIFQIHFASDKFLGGVSKIGSAETKFAFAQFCLTYLRKFCVARKGMRPARGRLGTSTASPNC